MALHRTVLLSILALVCLLNLTAQDTSLEVFVHDNYTEKPLESVMVKIFRDGIVIDSAYTNISGIANLRTVTSVYEGEGLPSSITLSHNYPNPFTEDTNVEIGVLEAQTITAAVYNVLGQRVASEEFPVSAGYHTLNLSLGHLPTGVYFLRIDGIESQAVKLLKMGSGIHRSGPLFSISQIGAPDRVTVGEKAGSELTIRAEKDRYDVYESVLPMPENREVAIPLSRNNMVEFIIVDNQEASISLNLQIRNHDYQAVITTPQTLTLKSGVYNVKGGVSIDRNIEIASVDTTIALLIDQEIVHLADAVIGNGGGILTAESFTMTVPQGAFDTTFDISLLKTNERDFQDYQIGATYRISGLPEQWAKDLEIRIVLDTQPDETMHVAFGESGFSMGTGGAYYISYFMEEAIVEGSTLIAILPASAPDPVDLALLKTGMYQESEATSALQLQGESRREVNVKAVRGYSTVVAGNSRYISLSLPRDHFTIGVDFADELLAAYRKYESMGYAMDRRSWPVSVTVRPGLAIRGEPVDGVMNPGYWRSSGSIEINLSIINDPIKRRVTGAHELFHIVQSLYDPRVGYNRAKGYRYHTHWLDEATATWAEYFFAPNPTQYAPDPVFGIDVVPLHLPLFPLYYGLRVPSVQGVTRWPTGENITDEIYGYSMHSLIRYMTKRWGDDIVRKVYDAVWGGIASTQRSVEILLEQTGERPEIWWPDYVKSYVMGEITPGLTNFIFNLWQRSTPFFTPDTFDIISSSDTLFVHSAKYNAKQTRMYGIRPLFKDAPDDAQIKIEVDNGVAMVVHIHRDERREYMGRAYAGSPLTLNTSVKDLYRDGHRSYVLIFVNHPYDDEEEIKLKVMVDFEDDEEKIITTTFHEEYLTRRIIPSPSAFEGPTIITEFKIDGEIVMSEKNSMRFNTSFLNRDDMNSSITQAIDIRSDKEGFVQATVIQPFSLWNWTWTHPDGTYELNYSYTGAPDITVTPRKSNENFNIPQIIFESVSGSEYNNEYFFRVDFDPISIFGEESVAGWVGFDIRVYFPFMRNGDALGFIPAMMYLRLRDQRHVN